MATSFRGRGKVIVTIWTGGMRRADARCREKPATRAARSSLRFETVSYDLANMRNGVGTYALFARPHSSTLANMWSGGAGPCGPRAPPRSSI